MHHGDHCLVTGFVLGKQIQNLSVEISGPWTIWTTVLGELTNSDDTVGSDMEKCGRNAREQTSSGGRTKTPWKFIAKVLKHSSIDSSLPVIAPEVNVVWMVCFWGPNTYSPGVWKPREPVFFCCCLRHMMSHIVHERNPPPGIYRTLQIVEEFVLLPDF